MNDAVFRRTIGNIRKHRDINLVITERTRNYLVLKPIIILERFSQKVYEL